MSEIKSTCSSCGAEVEDETGLCAQCANKVDEVDAQQPADENNTESENFSTVSEPKSAKSTKSGILVAIAAGILILGLISGYFLNSLLGNSANGTKLSGPWTGTMTFTKITSSDKTFESKNQANLNQAENIGISIFMYDSKSGGASISGLTATGATVPVTYSNGKMNFTIKSADIVAVFDCDVSKDKASGAYKIKGTIKYSGKVDDGTGKKVDLAASGNLDLSLAKRS